MQYIHSCFDRQKNQLGLTDANNHFSKEEVQMAKKKKKKKKTQKKKNTP
jgi:hypothetical protein